MAINDIIILAILILSTVGGFISGFFKKASKRLAPIGGIFASFYLGNWFCGLIENIEVIKEFKTNYAWAPTVILIGSYIVIYVVVWLLLKIIFGIINKSLEDTKALKVINKILGLVFGVFSGMILVELYARGLYGVSCISESVAQWAIADGRLAEAGNTTIIKRLLELNLGSIGATFPGL